MSFVVVRMRLDRRIHMRETVDNSGDMWITDKHKLSYVCLLAYTHPVYVVTVWEN